ncbi:MAG: hypothetical protein IT382_24615, partial [Deltaproteobacteria bacterium]|nr:hypothetical protein [Deltaproteobacteria bacterium]
GLGYGGPWPPLNAPELVGAPYEALRAPPGALPAASPGALPGATASTGEGGAP